MRITITGRGTSGSWQIRGVQLGEALGAKVERNATKFVDADMVIVVKRVRPEYLQPLLAARLPIVWDVVDAWPQPVGNEWTRISCLNWLRTEIKVLHPAALVVSTHRMKDDCAEFGLPVLVLPHHAKPGQALNPIRACVSKVGYEGAEHYLGVWRARVAHECEALHYTFVINPPRLSDVDIVLGLRDCPGYAPRNWKSNVKLANAQGSGTPCIMSREQGYLETASNGGVAWADDETELKLSFRVLADYRMRRAASEKLLESQPKLEVVAGRYREWLQQI